MSQNINEPTENDESVENIEDINIKEHIICHCRTKLNFKNFDYTWNITDFSVTCRSMNSLPICKIRDQPFIITASLNKKTNIFRFAILFDSGLEKGIQVNYYIYIQTTEGIGMPLNEKNVYLRHNQTIYEIFLKDLYEQKSTYLPNDTLTVCFQFEIIESLSYNYINQTIGEIEEPTYSDNFLMVSNTKLNSFVTIVIDEKQLYINKELLCSKSDVFEAMFNSEMKESNTDIVEINDITYDVFKYLISYMETGNLANLKMNADINYTKTLYDLIAAANKYNIKDLRFLCENLLIKNTSKDNVIEHLNIAHLHNASFLEQYTIKFIKLYENIITQTSDFKSLIPKFPELVTKIKKVKLDSMIYVYE